VIALFPFRIQSKTVKNAEEGLCELLWYADSVIVMDNDRYRTMFPNLLPEKVYATVNEIAADVLRRLIESISLPYLINIDPDDFPSLFRNKGMAIILAGESGDSDGDINEQVVRHCLNSPSFDIDYRSATGCIVLITAGHEFKQDDIGEIVSLLTNELNPATDVVWCSNKNKSMNGKVRVYGIMTGIQQHSYGGNNPKTKEHVKRERTYEGPY
jgi:cell division protein FtsZ